MIMVGDSVKQKDERVPVKDIAEILLEQIEATTDRAAADALKVSG
jgi:hypothetical protein